MTQKEIKDKIADWKNRLKNPSVAGVPSAVTKINSEITKLEVVLEKEEKPKAEKKEKVAKEPKKHEAKESKSEEKAEVKTESKKTNYNCDELIKEAKERLAKAKATAEARAEASKKTDATKDREKIEKVHEAVEKQVEAGKLTKKQLMTLINETKDLLKLLEKSLKNL